MIFLSIALILALPGAVRGQEDEAEVPKAYTEDATFILNQPVFVNARKMSQVLGDQDVVATCRYVLFKTWVDWYEAKDRCENITLPMTLRVKGSMATVKSEIENQDLVLLMKAAYGVKHLGRKFDRRNWIWLGLERVRNNDVKQPRNKKGEEFFVPDEWRWVDGSAPVYWRWMKTMPDGQYDKKTALYQDKVSLSKKGHWDDSLQYKTMPYACNYCGKYVVIKHHATWYEARRMCEGFGLTMAIVNTRAENEDLDKAAKLMMGAETDIKRWNDTNWIWLGTQEVMGEDGVGTGVWEHHDGTPLLWSPPWDVKKQPDNWKKKQGEQQKVAFSRINTNWDDSFPWKKRPFACMCPEAACTANVY